MLCFTVGDKPSPQFPHWRMNAEWMGVEGRLGMGKVYGLWYTQSNMLYLSRRTWEVFIGRDFWQLQPLTLTSHVSFRERWIYFQKNWQFVNFYMSYEISINPDTFIKNICNFQICNLSIFICHTRYKLTQTCFFRISATFKYALIFQFSTI